MRLGDHMMFIQLQLSTQTGARRTRPSPVQLPTPHSMTVHDHQEVPSPTYTPDAGSNGIPYNLHQFRSFPESEKVNSAHGALRNVKTKIIIRFSLSLSLSLSLLCLNAFFVIYKVKFTGSIPKENMFSCCQKCRNMEWWIRLFFPRNPNCWHTTHSSKCNPPWQLVHLVIVVFLCLLLGGIYKHWSADPTHRVQVPAPVVSSSSPRVPCFVRHHGAGHCLRHSTKPSIGLTSSWSKLPHAN